MSTAGFMEITVAISKRIDDATGKGTGRAIQTLDDVGAAWMQDIGVG